MNKKPTEKQNTPEALPAVKEGEFKVSAPATLGNQEDLDKQAEAQKAQLAKDAELAAGQEKAAQEGVAPATHATGETQSVPMEFQGIIERPKEGEEQVYGVQAGSDLLLSPDHQRLREAARNGQSVDPSIFRPAGDVQPESHQLSTDEKTGKRETNPEEVG